jgi:hypothetical protein
MRCIDIAVGNRRMPICAVVNDKLEFVTAGLLLKSILVIALLYYILAKSCTKSTKQPPTKVGGLESWTESPDTGHKARHKKTYFPAW